MEVLGPSVAVIALACSEHNTDTSFTSANVSRLCRNLKMLQRVWPKKLTFRLMKVSERLGIFRDTAHRDDLCDLEIVLHLGFVQSATLWLHGKL